MCFFPTSYLELNESNFFEVEAEQVIIQKLDCWKNADKLEAGLVKSFMVGYKLYLYTPHGQQCQFICPG